MSECRKTAKVGLDPIEDWNSWIDRTFTILYVG